MAGVFDGQIKTRTRVAIDRDAFQPGMGALGAGSETEEALIHGNRKEKVDGNWDYTVVGTTSVTLTGAVTIRCLSTLNTNVIGASTITFIGAVTSTYISNVIRTIIAQELHTTIGPTIDNRIAVYLRNHAAPATKNDPTVLFEIAGQKVKLEPVKITIGILKTDIYAASLGFYGFKFDLSVMKARKSDGDIAAGILKLRAGGAKADAEGAKAAVAGAKPEAGGANPRLEPEVNGAPTANPTGVVG